jgi:hypothetical protein
VGAVVIEASVVAGYVVAWALRKTRRAASRLDAEVDAAVDAGLDRLHDAVAAKLGAHPALDELDEEAGAADGAVSELTRQQVELAIAAAARKDEAFGAAVTELLARVREAERQAGTPIVAGGNARVFTGGGHAEATGGGIAFGQVGGDVHVERGGRERPNPS